jgi:hypothetical protein
MRGQPSDTADVHTVFTQVCLEQLRRDVHTFAADRHKDQYHTPRNLLLALVAEVRGRAAAPGTYVRCRAAIVLCHISLQGLRATHSSSVGSPRPHTHLLDNPTPSQPNKSHLLPHTLHFHVPTIRYRLVCWLSCFSGGVRCPPASLTGQHLRSSMWAQDCLACCCTLCAWQTCVGWTWAGQHSTSWHTQRHCECGFFCSGCGWQGGWGLGGGFPANTRCQWQSCLLAALVCLWELSCIQLLWYVLIRTAAHLPCLPPFLPKQTHPPTRFFLPLQHTSTLVSPPPHP